MRGRRDGREAAGKGEVLKSVVLGSLIAILLASSVAVVSAARTLDIAPNVGDILVFRTTAQMTDTWDITATNTEGKDCTLKPSVMVTRGGSLVVEQRIDDSRVYRVHWAGGPTAVGAADCGLSANLTLSREALQLLSNAVGGPGVEHKAFGYF